MKAKEIILLLFIIAAGVLFYHIQTGKIDAAWDDFVAFDFTDYTYQETQVIEPPLPASLKVLNSHGEVEVVGAETDRITFVFEKRVWRRNEERAKEVADQLHPIVTKSDADITITSNRADFKRRNFETNFRITVPAGLAVDIANSYGTVKADQVGETSIKNPHGDVTLTHVQGGALIENSYEDVQVSDLKSNCTIKSGHADIVAKEIAGEVNIEDSYGMVDLRNVGQKATITAPHTEIWIEDVAGPLEVRNSYEKISLRRVGASRLEGSHSEINAEAVTGNLEITDSYEPVALRAVRGNLQINGDHVSVSAGDVVGDSIYVSSTYEDVGLADFSGKTTIVLSHGEITLTPLPLTAPLEVRATYSPIRLFWPGEDHYPVDAQTKSSEIYWNLSGNVSSEQKDSLTLLRAFSEATDKPQILLSTTYGDIQFEKGPAR
jgi:DUF4097 and DUF4098 domain-containing protein YvlB